MVMFGNWGMGRSKEQQVFSSNGLIQDSLGELGLSRLRFPAVDRDPPTLGDLGQARAQLLDLEP
jgi:hypothetical protein